MNRDQANALVSQIFTQAFDKNRFRNFTLNLVNHIDESKAFAPRTGQYIKKAFEHHVHSLERFGTYTSPENEKLDILIVHLTANSKLERARTAIRNFVADHLKARDEKDAALVAFVSPMEKQWRFSYVKMEYATVEKESGKVGVEARLTPARRFSYIVGEGESCHTAQTRFLDLLQDTETDPVLTDIEEAFSVEAVTKEFFTKYAELFEEIHTALEKLASKDKTLRDELKAKNVNTVDFAKKLMGQIVFLYFLQKKGWLGVEKGKEWGTGPRDFLRRLANREFGKYDNFFNDILEPLFYDTLATDRGHEAWDKRFNCRIPFLNGGLFEPLGDYDWKKTDIILPNRFFTNTEFVEEGITGTGVLDVFDRYNFTVNEAEPLEKEVAIDPEMLGKVFENLIEENLRKGLGSYYTPREIVHYMCQESLINYLDTALNTHNNQSVIASPAAGGAKQSDYTKREIASSSARSGLLAKTGGEQVVPRADIETFVHLGEQISHYESVEAEYRVKMPRSIQQHAKRIDDALAGITVCDPAVGSGAFPVGIMTEIVRARSALTPYFNDVHERTPYHFKRHAIQNCLYGVDIDAGAVEIAKLRLWLSLVVDEEETRQIKPLPNLDYKIVFGNSLFGVEKNLFNSELFEKLERLKPSFFDETDSFKKASLKEKIDDLIHRLTNGKESFDFEIYFSEVFHKSNGFDVIIMNPPYGAEFNEREKDILKKKYEHIVERIRNSFLYFMGLGYNIAKDNGVCCYILPNEFLFQIYMTKARKFFISNSQVLFAVNTGEDVFEAIVPTCVVAFKKHKLRSYELPVADFRDSTRENLSQLLNTRSFQLSSKEIVLGTPNAMVTFDLHRTKLVNKLAEQFTKFEEYCGDVANGVCTGYDAIYIVGEEFAKSQKFEPENLRPCIRGGQMNRFYCPPNTQEYLLYITDDFSSKRARNINSYLLEHKKLLIEKSIEKKNGNREWHVLFRPRYPELFEKPKIMIRQTADRIIAAVDSHVGYYCINSINVALVKPEHSSYIQYLLGVLNSSLLNFFYTEISQEHGRVLAEVKPQRIRSLPIVTASEDQRSRMKLLVSRIVQAKQGDPDADTTALEREIDQLVYKLYGLTEEEIKVVEEKP